MPQDIGQLTRVAINQFRAEAIRLANFPELAAELNGIADALERANADRIAAEKLLAEMEAPQ